jgi:hypothetical protein
MLLERYQRVGEEIRFFVDYLAALSLVVQEKRAVERETKIAKIQGVGEYALFLALLPYYMGSVINHIWMSGKGLLWPSSELSPRPEEGLANFVIWLICATGCGVAFLYYKFAEKKKEKGPGKKDVGLASVANAPTGANATQTA